MVEVERSDIRVSGVFVTITLTMPSSEDAMRLVDAIVAERQLHFIMKNDEVAINDRRPMQTEN